MEIKNSTYDDSWYFHNDLFLNIDVKRRLGVVPLYGCRIRGSRYHYQEVMLPIKFEWMPDRRKVIPVLDRKNIQPLVLERINYQEANFPDL